MMTLNTLMLECLVAIEQDDQHSSWNKLNTTLSATKLDCRQKNQPLFENTQIPLESI